MANRSFGDYLALPQGVEQSRSSRTRFIPTIGNSAEQAAVEAGKAELAKAVSANETRLRLQSLIVPVLENELERHDRIVSVNDLADRDRRNILKIPQAAAALARVSVVGLRPRVEHVRTLGIAEVQAEFDRTFERCAMLKTIGLSGFREGTKRMAVQHRELRAKYLQSYPGQLRAYTDEHRLLPAQVAERIHQLQFSI